MSFKETTDACFPNYSSVYSIINTPIFFVFAQQNCDIKFLPLPLMSMFYKPKD